MNISPHLISDKEELYQLIVEEITVVFGGLAPEWFRLGLEQVKFDVSTATGLSIDYNDVRDAIVWHSRHNKDAWIDWISGIVEPFNDILQNFGILYMLLPDCKQFASNTRYVYLFRVSGSITSFKIGISVNPRTRAGNIAQPGLEVDIIHAFAADEARAAEQLLHQHFAAKQIALEYFDLDQGDIDWIRSIRAFAGGKFLTETQP